MARLDSYSGYPSGMEEYLNYYGWHFSKKMCEWASNKMYKTINSKPVRITPYTKEDVDRLLDKLGIKIEYKGYDAVYVANMCKADYLGGSIRDEGALGVFVKETIGDPDGYEGMVFTRFYADCIGSGTPINWEDMI